MNAVIKEAFKEDIRYAVSMYVYMIVVASIFGAIGLSVSGMDTNVFYMYIGIFGILITSIYCTSKARMDRYFAMGFSRSVFMKQCIVLGIVRSAVMAVGYMMFALLVSRLSGLVLMFGVTDENGAMSQKMEAAVGILLFFLFGWAANNHMLVDAVMEKPRLAASVYLTSPNLWSFNNNKKAKNRNGSRLAYFLMVFIYSMAATSLLVFLQLLFRWWLLAEIVVGLVILNLILVTVFARKIKTIDIV